MPASFSAGFLWGSRALVSPGLSFPPTRFSKRLALIFPPLIALSVLISEHLVHYGIILREEALSETQVRQRIPALQDEDPTILVAILRSVAESFFQPSDGGANGSLLQSPRHISTES